MTKPDKASDKQLHSEQIAQPATDIQKRFLEHIRKLVDDNQRQLSERQEERMPPHTVAIRNIGKLDRMLLPDDWNETEKKLPSGSLAYLKRFTSGNSDANICFYFPGRLLTQEEANAFQSMLKKQGINDKPHINDSPQAIAEARRQLEGVLGNMSDEKSFHIEKLGTKCLDNKSVLVVEGTYIESGKGMFDIIVDYDKTGTVPQEIYYEASRKPDPETGISPYDQRLTVAIKAFNSIKWK